MTKKERDMPAETIVRFERPVVCVWCNNRYRSIMPGDNDNYTQGDGCAAVCIYNNGQWLIEGFYGSTSYDTDVFRFVKNLPTERADPICDNCIGERIKAGDLVRAGSGAP
jgi:hypothetical protein